jgi:hypothetical protein
LNDSIANWDKRVIERDYWLRVYTYLNRYLSDPLYHAESFWDLSCTYIEDVYGSLEKVERDRLQGQSVTTAYLTDVMLSITHSLYGKNDGKYKSQPQVFLPGYKPDENAIIEETHDVSSQTISVFMDEYKADRIPDFAVMHLMSQIAEWSEKVES